jgi:AAA ATPase-like protein
MYVSLPQIVTSLQRLGDVHPFFGYAFLGFKKCGTPIGSTTEFHYKYIREEILDPYFKIGGQQKYFNPFKSNQRWVSERYESTSLQRIVADTFSEAFIRKKASSEWGWQRDYVEQLHVLMKKTKTLPIPALDLAVWLYRKNDVREGATQEVLIDRLFSEFEITAAEIDLLFDSHDESRTVDLVSDPVNDIELLNQLGWPDGANERSGASIDKLKLLNVGPSAELEYSPAPRINIITGDNSLGKTFLLDCAWWSLTGTWMAYPADPSSNRKSRRSEIAYSLSSENGRHEDFVAPYSLLQQEWQRPHQPIQGLALYTNFSGGFALWDPILSDSNEIELSRSDPYINFRRDEVWNGLVSKDFNGREKHVSNGLIRDWISWQQKPSLHKDTFPAFEATLKELSPPEGFQLRPGKPTTLANDSREIPTIRMPYGDVPIVYASAGIQRALSLAYMLVWSWFRHFELSKRADREPIRKMVVIIDEIESHLHPKWQRQIIPALVNAIHSLGQKIDVQLHVSSHSPLVLASLEPLYSFEKDRIHNLVLSEGDVSIEILDNWKHGTVNYWLESEVFGLKEARSKPAEIALDQANALLTQKAPDKAAVEKSHRDLVRLLPDDDPFWVRWGYFYKQHGQNEI